MHGLFIRVLEIRKLNLKRCPRISLSALGLMDGAFVFGSAVDGCI